MAKLTMTKGLPGSGKSTWALSQIEDGFRVRVNKDDIRRELEKTGWTWSKRNEQDVIRLRDTKIIEALKLGLSVISDDTNLATKHEDRLKDLARKFGAEFEVKDFTTKVTVEECIRRDSFRDGKAKVGEKVIKDMAKQYLGWTDPIVKYEPKAGTPSAIICDLDGTLALHDGRSPYDTAKADTDLVNGPVADILMTYHDSTAYHVLFVSGREEKFRDVTINWLKDNHLLFGPLWMRPTGDTRNDAIVKMEIFDHLIRDKFNIRFVLDDRDRVVRMWRSLGLTCLQCNYGDF